LTGKTKQAAARVLTDEQRKLLHELSRALKNTVPPPGTTNPPNTAGHVIAGLRRVSTGLAGAVGLSAGDITTAVLAAATRKVANEWYNRRAGKKAVEMLKSDVPPPADVSGTMSGSKRAAEAAPVVAPKAIGRMLDPGEED
jgi:hypothetical protein